MRYRNADSLPLLALLALLAAAPFAARAQTTPTGGVGIGTTAPDISAALDIVSSTKGALLPRVADATALATPATGLLVFQTGGTAGFYYNAGTPAAPSWQQLVTGAAGTTFIQNTTSQQASSNFNVSGDGTVGGTLTAANAVVTTALTGNGADLGSVVGLGVRADGGLNIGQNTSGNSLYLGYQAGRVSTGSSNQFSGYQSGYSNTTGSNNTFSGYGSGYTNTSSNNTFSGYGSGYSNSTGQYNTYTGAASGLLNTTGQFNVMSGYASGQGSTSGGTNTGSNNVFTGAYSGFVTTTGSQNTFVGNYAGRFNDTGSSNTALGSGSGPANGSGALTNATALGANVTLTTSNTVVLGNGANVGIGTAAPGQKLTVAGGIAATGGEQIRTQGAHLQWNRNNGDGETWLLNQRGLGVGGIRFGASDAVSGVANTVTEWARFDSNGNLGLGTPNPGQRLEVAGGIKFTGTGSVLTFPDGTTQPTAATTATGANFIQNTTTPQAAANFNVSGNGTVGGTLTATYAVVSTALTGSGASIGSVVGVGVRADGGLNIGQNTSGNLFLGYQAGAAVTPLATGEGSRNQFSGYQAGAANTTGRNNIFTGYRSGAATTTGQNNVFSGYQSGVGNTTGDLNVFVGTLSGTGNTSGSSNTVVGSGSGLASGALTNATALGANVTLTTNNTVILGNGANVGIGTPSPGQKLEVAGGIKFTGTGNVLTFPDGTTQATAATTATGTSFIQNQTAADQAGGFRISGNGLVGGSLAVGTTAAPAEALDVVGNVRVPAANAYKYAAAKNYSLHLGAADFQPQATGSTKVIGSYHTFYSGTATGTFEAPVRLPQGATIASLNLFLADNVPSGSITVRLQALGFAANAPITLATFTSTDAGTFTSSTVPVSGALVDNVANTYYLEVVMSASSIYLALGNVRLNYTVMQAE